MGYLAKDCSSDNQLQDRESNICQDKNMLTKIPIWAGKYVLGIQKKLGIKELGTELGHLANILKYVTHSDGQFLTLPTYLGQP